MSFIPSQCRRSAARCSMQASRWGKSNHGREVTCAGWLSGCGNTLPPPCTNFLVHVYCCPNPNSADDRLRDDRLLRCARPVFCSNTSNSTQSLMRFFGTHSASIHDSMVAECGALLKPETLQKQSIAAPLEGGDWMHPLNLVSMRTSAMPDNCHSTLGGSW